MLTRLAVLFCLLWCAAMASAATYNAATDFSTTANPSGAWSYLGVNDAPLTANANVLGGWGPGWSTGSAPCVAPWPGNPSVLISHGEPLVVRWTAPADGNVVISGQAYHAGVDPANPPAHPRDLRFLLKYNGGLVSQIDMPNSGGAKWYALAAGSGGAAVLAFGVKAGDKVDFVNGVMGSTPASVMGLDLTVNFTAGTPNPPPPVSQIHQLGPSFSTTANPNGAWSYLGNRNELLTANANVLGGWGPGWGTGDTVPCVVAWPGNPNVLMSHGDNMTFRWTAPAKGNVLISGKVFNAGVDLNNPPANPRDLRFLLKYNGGLASQIDMPNSGGNKWYGLTEGTGGGAALVFGVQPGDKVDFVNSIMGSTPSSVMGTEVTVTFTASDNPLPPPAVVYTYDAEKDMTFTSNPNGVWSYLTGDRLPLVLDEDLWGWKQKAWALKDETVPVIMPSAGYLYNHGPSALCWTAPADGNVVISGEAVREWRGSEGRNIELAFTLDGALFSKLELLESEDSKYPLGSGKPISLGSGGAKALSFGVKAGQKIEVLNNTAKGTAIPTFCFLDLVIVFTPGTPEKPPLTQTHPFYAFGAVSNPNGPWSYRHATTGELLPKQTQILGTEGVAGWAPGTTGGDAPAWFGCKYEWGVSAGAIGSHGPALLRWTAPAAGTVTINGGAYNGGTQPRDLVASIRLNDQPLTQLELLASEVSKYNPLSPRPFAAGTGGAEALSFTVKPGDRVDFVNTAKAGSIDSIMGMDFYITLQPPINGAGDQWTFYQ